MPSPDMSGRKSPRLKRTLPWPSEEVEKGPLLEDVSKLHDDWDALVALDEMLKKESLI